MKCLKICFQSFGHPANTIIKIALRGNVQSNALTIEVVYDYLLHVQQAASNLTGQIQTRDASNHDLDGITVSSVDQPTCKI